MSTKELIQQEIDKLDESRLSELYEVVKRLQEPKINPENPKRSFMERLGDISISAPRDFSENLDLYLSGAKQVEDVH